MFPNFSTARYREVPKSVGSSGEILLRVICVLDVEQSGIPALEPLPERVIENPGSGLKHQVRARL